MKSYWQNHKQNNAFVLDENFDNLASWKPLPILLITSDSLCDDSN